MKVLHLATHDTFGGAARAAYRQHTALRRHGVDSEMLVRHKHSNDTSVVQYAGNPHALHRVARVVRRTWIGYQEKRSRKRCREIICGLNDPRADLLRSVDARMAEADVINIHKVEHFVDVPALLPRLGSSKPVVITMHDLSAITGGCDYAGSCRRFEQSCGCCPIINSRRPADYSHRIFGMKKAAYSEPLPNRMAFAANSRWSAACARVSGLSRDRRIDVIHYGIDQKVYSPRKRLQARAALGVQSDEHVLFFAAHDISLPHKGGQYVREALSFLAGSKPIRLLTMGAGRFEALPGFNHTNFGRVESDGLQALLYRAADVFIIPSLEEAFGQTALEAIACGTMVAGFDSGGISDIVANGVNGVLVTRGDASALSGAISQLLEDEPLRMRWQLSCEDWVGDRFSNSRNAAAYVALYKSLLNIDLQPVSKP
jgi:glycosyltransferase involved in cell wall biosynthesis